MTTFKQRAQLLRSAAAAIEKSDSKLTIMGGLGYAVVFGQDEKLTPSHYAAVFDLAREAFDLFFGHGAMISAVQLSKLGDDMTPEEISTFLCMAATLTEDLSYDPGDTEMEVESAVDPTQDE